MPHKSATPDLLEMLNMAARGSIQSGHHNGCTAQVPTEVLNKVLQQQFSHRGINISEDFLHYIPGQK